MMSLETIQTMSRERAKESYEAGERPMDIPEVEWRNDLNACHEGHLPESLRHIPNLGDVDMVIEQHDGQYELVETLFVDKLGWNIWDAGGPALSVGGFAKRGLELTQEHGTLYWMLGDEGQFQIHAFALKRLSKAKPDIREILKAALDLELEQD